MEPTPLDAWSRKLWAYRHAIAAFVIVAVILAAAAAFTMPPWYTATASLLPPTQQDVGLGVDALSDDGSAPVLSIPSEVTPADIFIIELTSPWFHRQIVERFGLARVYKTHFTVDAVKVLTTHVKFDLTGAGTITMQVEDTNAARAAAILQGYIDLLNRFNRDLRDAHLQRTRTFVEERLAGIKAQLSQSEQALADYQARHKETILTRSVSSAADKAAGIYANRVALETQLGVIRSYTRANSQEEQQLEDRIAQLDHQLATLPQMDLQLVHLLREVKTYAMINGMLTAQYEDARIKEARNAPMVEPLDVPISSERKSRPHRLLLVLLGSVIGLAVGVAYASFEPDAPDFIEARAAAAH